MASVGSRQYNSGRGLPLTACQWCGVNLKAKAGKDHPLDGSCRFRPRPASKHQGSKPPKRKRKRK